MKDVAPELWAQLINTYEEAVTASRSIQAFHKRIDEGKATQAELVNYAKLLGNIAAKACHEVLTDEALPDGILYWNIAERTVLELMKRIHADINRASIAIIGQEWKKKGIGLKPQEVPFANGRMRMLLDELMNSTEVANEQKQSI